MHILALSSQFCPAFYERGIPQSYQVLARQRNSLQKALYAQMRKGRKIARLKMAPQSTPIKNPIIAKELFPNNTDCNFRR